MARLLRVATDATEGGASASARRARSRNRRGLRSVVAVWTATATVITLLIATPTPASAVPPTVVPFTYTGGSQSWPVPAGVTAIQVDAYGAEGGFPAGAEYAGLGGHIQATISVTPGESLQINVGGQATTTAGGWNGGGNADNGGRGGGGGTDLRRGGTALSNRVVVAGGGGGAANVSSGPRGAGGSGGGASGLPGDVGEANGVQPTGGGGGTQTAGGAGGVCGGNVGTPGALGAGGNMHDSFGWQGGGGGGGFYGGGSGTSCNTYTPGSGGGGGSSYASPSAINVIQHSGFRLGNGQLLITYPPTVTPPTTPTPGTATFNAATGPQFWPVPAGVTAVSVDASGAQGGGPDRGGLGGRITATLAVTPGETLQINVGTQPTTSAGGFNGGGSADNAGLGGGGATDVRQAGTALGNRVVVAGGGGGAGAAGNTGTTGSVAVRGSGGSGGGTTASQGDVGEISGTVPTGGAGGSQSGGGAGGVCGSGVGTAGSADHGGDMSQGFGWMGGGGGAGYFGGGSGTSCNIYTPGSGGGGGSSYTAIGVGGGQQYPGVRQGNGVVTLTWPPALPPIDPAPAGNSQTFNHTGGSQWWPVPPGVNAISVQVQGAQGGGSAGGLGGRVDAILSVTPGQSVQVNVGGQGSGVNGGFNGGGNSDNSGSGGGGASDVRISGVGLANRAAIGGGGGGTGWGQFVAAGGSGGGFSGGAGGGSADGAPGGGGGTQTAGGAAPVCSNHFGSPGAIALGANHPTGGGGEGGGGGGGLYGGASGISCNIYTPGSGGGGGSSGIDPYVALEGSTVAGTRSGNGVVVISWPAPSDSSRVLGNDTYGEIVKNVHTGSGNYVQPVTDVKTITSGPALELTRTYNSLDTRVGLFGTGWSSTYEMSVSSSGNTATVLYPDGRREPYAKQPDGSYTAPKGYTSTLTLAGGNWTLKQKDLATFTFRQSDGKLTTIADAYNRQLTITYDGSNRLSVATDVASGRTLTFGYNGAGTVVTSLKTNTVTSTTYSGQLIWNYEYTGSLLTKACDARNPSLTTGICETYGYTSNKLTLVTQPKLNTGVKVSYRADGRVDWVENGTADRTSFAYGGGITQVTDPRGFSTQYFYDGMFRTVRIVDGLFGTQSYGYDGNGFRNKIVDPNNHVQTRTYDAKANQLTDTNAKGETTYYTYDANDNLIEMRDACSTGLTDNRYKTTFTYNAAKDNLLETSPPTTEYPLGVTKTKTYTVGGENFGWGPVPAGLLRTFDPGLGGVTSYEYDNKGDLRRRTMPSGLVATFTYDELGRPLAATNTFETGSWATTNEWDQLGNLLSLTESPVTNAAVTPNVVHQAKTSYIYDNNRNRTTTTTTDIGGSGSPTPTRQTVTEYDNDERAWRVTDPEGFKTTRTFDANNNVVTVTDAENRMLRTDYDALNRPTALTLLAFVDDPVVGTTPRDVVVKRVSYDLGGRMTAEFSLRTGTGGLAGQADPIATPMRQTSYAYDDADRPTATTLRDYANRVGVTPPARDIVVESKAYDAAGNIITTTAGGGQQVVDNVYDESRRVQSSTIHLGSGVDRVTTYDYDKDGNATVVRVTQGSSVTETRLLYDTSDRLMSSTVENGAVDLKTTYGYDKRGARINTVDPRGNVSGGNPSAFQTDYSFDVAGRLAQTQLPTVSIEAVGGTAANGRPTTKLGYDNVGNQTHSVDERGNGTTQTFDRLNRRVGVSQASYTQPNGGLVINASETWTYDDVGNVETYLNRRGKLTQYRYDNRNRLIRQTDPVVGANPAGVSSFTFDDAGHQVSTTDQTGALTTATYDDLDRIRTQTQVVRQPVVAGSYTTVTDYDDLGDLTFVSDPTGITSTATYDGAGERLSTIDAIGKVTSYAYDAGGRLTKVTDPVGRITESVYDQAGRATSTKWGTTTIPLLAQDYSTYDEVGNLTQYRSARSASASDNTYKTAYSYDAANRLSSVVEPKDGVVFFTTTYGYNAAGGVTRLTDGRANVTTYTYNSWNLLESTIEPAAGTQTTPAARTFTTNYDAGGLPQKSVAPRDTITRTFDELGRLVTKVGANSSNAPADVFDGITANNPAATTTYGYDLAGRLTSTSHPLGPITLVNDDRGLLLTSSVPNNAASVAASFGYDAAGRMASRTDAAGTTAYTYDQRGDLRTAADTQTNVTQTYTRNDARQVNNVAYNTTPARNRVINYDDRGWIKDDTTTAATTVGEAYVYDNDGNLKTQTITAPGNPSAGAHQYTYDNGGRLLSWQNPAGQTTGYTYDAAGNRTTAGIKTYVYDQRNRLTSDGTTTFAWTSRDTLFATKVGAAASTTIVYDSLGRQTKYGATNYQYDALDRLTKRGSSALLYDGNELKPVSTTGSLLVRSPDGRLLAQKTGANASVVELNRHGDLASLLSPAGAITDTRVFDPYGAPIGSTGTSTVPIGFQADYTDPTTGNVDMGARWYSPTAADFQSRDSVAGVLSSPFTLNRYTYAVGDPLQYFDPDGHWPDLPNPIDAVKSAASWVNDNVIQPVFNAAKSAVSFSLSGLNDALSWAMDKAKQGASAVKDAAVSTYNAVSHGVKKVYSTARTVVRQAVRATFATISRVRDTAAAGINFVKEHADGIKQGLKLVAAGVAAVTATAACMGGSALAATPGCLALGGATFAFVNSALNCPGQSASDCAKSVVISTAAGGLAGYTAGLVPGSGFIGTLAQGYAFGATDNAAHQLLSTGRIDFAEANQAGMFAAATAGTIHIGAKGVGMALGSRAPPTEAGKASGGAAETPAGAVNKVGGTHNCTACAIGGDSTLAGRPASALNLYPGEPIPGGNAAIAQYAGKPWRSVSGQAEIEAELLAGGNGSRGIVYGSRAGLAHVWNAVVQKGQVNFVDFQGIGPSGPDAFKAWNNFAFVRTN